jgi:hypothetical protein
MTAQLAVQQPSNPHAFMSDYFENVVTGMPPLMRAFQLISMYFCFRDDVWSAVRIGNMDPMRSFAFWSWLLVRCDPH